jgi:G:T-mismatch repair DNA endonuclease (very short patch repair protein)
MNLAAYRERGWRTLVIWECALKGANERELESITAAAANWLMSQSVTAEFDVTHRKLAKATSQ